jgi:hypothetical protein
LKNQQLFLSLWRLEIGLENALQLNKKSCGIHHNILKLLWRPHGDSNPGYRRERQVRRYI